MEQNRLYSLLAKLTDQSLTDQEAEELQSWLESADRPQLVQSVYTKFLADYASVEVNVADVGDAQMDTIIKRLVSVDQYPSAKRVPRVHLLKTLWFRYAAAIIILFGIGAYLWNTQIKQTPGLSQSKPAPVKNDIAPGSNRAVLTLSDGRKVELIPETSRIAESGINIENANGRLEYGKAEKVVFNTMSTPRGGQYQLTLPDGTKVWLNAASSITYPTAFVNNIREVTMTGEAYFEVKSNKSKPFIVKTNKENITVLGTSFNVNGYTDEPVFKTSLMEGAVKINDRILKPGQAYSNGKIVQTNMVQDIAWKNGVFDFNGADVQKVMRQLSRWYDIDVKYTGKIPEQRFIGELSRDLTLKQVLETLADMNIRYTLNNRTLTIQ